MKLNRNGEFSMSRSEIKEFSSWLSNNPRERYKQFNDVVLTFLQHKGIESEQFSETEVSYA